MNPFSLVGTYGHFDTESDGRLSGTKIFVDRPRRDGKFPVTYVWGSGKRISKLYSLEKVQAAIESVTKRD